MIVIVSEVNEVHHLVAGSSFSLLVSAGCYSQEYHTVIEETIKKDCIIDYACTFVFCKKDGSCMNLNMAGFFGVKDNLPDEILNAKQINDLPPEQFKKFIETCPFTPTFE